MLMNDYIVDDHMREWHRGYLLLSSLPRVIHGRAFIHCPFFSMEVNYILVIDFLEKICET